MLKYISIVCTGIMHTMAFLYLIIERLGLKENVMLRIMIIITVILNVIALITSIIMENAYYILHIPGVIGCLISIVPSAILLLFGRRVVRIYRYSIFKFMIMVLYLINMLLSYFQFTYSPHIWIFLNVIFVLPDLDIVLNLHKIRTRLK